MAPRMKTITLKGAAAGAFLKALGGESSREEETALQIHMCVKEGNMPKAVAILEAYKKGTPGE